MPPSLLLKTIAYVWSALDDFPQKAVAGGLAVSFWGYARSTKDIDLALYIGHSNQLKDIAISLRRKGLTEKRPNTSRVTEEIEVYQWKYEIPETYVEVDVDLLLGSSDYFCSALSRSQPCSFSNLDVPMRVLSCEDLILFKALAGRLIDLADIRELMAVNRATLDMDYLRQQSTSLGLPIPMF